MPKDNEVDEKVIEAVAWQCRTEYSVWDECTKEKHDHIVATGHYGSPTSAKAEARALVPAATVAELRARADPAERRVGELEKLMAAARRAIGDHHAPNDCYATGPLTGDEFLDLVQCPDCAFLEQHEALTGADPT